MLILIMLIILLLPCCPTTVQAFDASPTDPQTSSALIEESQLPAAEPTPLQDSHFAGFFTIPSIGTHVPIYGCLGDKNGRGSTAQKYVDNQNSAALLLNWTQDPYFITIVDHADQAFARLPEITIGATATIEWKDGVYSSLQCCETIGGINTTREIIDANGLDWNHWECDVLVYTCAGDDGYNVFITKWNYS